MYGVQIKVIQARKFTLIDIYIKQISNKHPNHALQKIQKARTNQTQCRRKCNKNQSINKLN